MSRERPNRKIPEIDVPARAYLAGGLSRHPDIANHVERVEDVEKMGMWACSPSPRRRASILTR